MTPILIVLGAAFLGVALLWPLAFFGYRYYLDVVTAEEARHEQEGGGHH